MPEVFSFSDAVGRGPAILGGKGAGLAAMTSMGFNVPPGFVITTEVCHAYQATGSVPGVVMVDIERHLSELEQAHGRRLGDPDRPLLISVRSGAPVSMPGMMDSVLNLGVTRATRPALEREFGARFAVDTHRRFLHCFGTIVLGIPATAFSGVHLDTHVVPDVDALEQLVAAYEKVISGHHGAAPDDPHQQLALAVEAVFRSWDNPRARTYRELEAISHDLGTAVVVQSMVFGNRDDRSGTGVVFTRDPNTGERQLYGDFLFCAQGEDVVSGAHQTLPIGSLRERLPDVWQELAGELDRLERWRADMLDVEFTIEHRTLYFLQVRTAKRAATAAVRAAVEFAEDGLIDRATALLRVTPAQVETVHRPRLDLAAGQGSLTTGLAASPGVATGIVCLSPDRVADVVESGELVILVRRETSPNDLHGMALAEGIVTTRGGLVSHAAVVARGLGIPAVVGAEGIIIDEQESVLRIGDEVVAEGDVLTIDGATGIIARGALPVVSPTTSAHMDTLLDWADRASGRAGGDRPPSERLAAAHAALIASPLRATAGRTP